MHWSPLYEYDRRNVQSQAPAGQGVYALSDLDRIFYVGQCRNLKRRLLQHLKHTNTNHLVTRYLKRGCCFFRFAQIESARDLIDVERALIRRYRPPCNIDIRTIEERPRRTVLSLKTGPVTLHTNTEIGGPRSQVNHLLAEVALAIATRPAGRCGRWAVGIDRGHVVCVPYGNRDRLRPVWLYVKEADAAQEISPATWQRVCNRIQNDLADGQPCHPDPDTRPICRQHRFPKRRKL